MSATSNWKPAFDCHLSIGGTEQPATTAEFGEEVEEFDTTNTVSQGDYEFGVATTTRPFRCTIPVDSLNPVIPPVKSLVAGSFNDGINTYSGSVRVLKRTHKGGGKGGYFIDIEGKFTGAVTTS
jgi:hypothetical protein